LALQRSRINNYVQSFGCSADSPLSDFFRAIDFLNDTETGGASPKPVSSGTWGVGTLKRTSEAGMTTVEVDFQANTVLPEYTSSPSFRGSRAPEYGSYQSDLIDLVANEYDESLRELFRRSNREDLLDKSLYNVVATLLPDSQRKFIDGLRSLQALCDRPA
jgi:hypothetical protein